ncbi:leucyl aminopeptidase [Bacillus ectoiniformans]|uniref:leucyl aminopeptidase n=1 Tax=Bacillus ectoiniformans TaxID=1494429 RepID=UPI0019575570|nr:leucyl aminopeptidase [Bacillus ectoiniformans]MBM7648520.1 leucyl aminopeptidase [Bacillus ectoiniformans]
MFTVKNELFLQQTEESLIVGLYDKPIKFEGALKELDDAFDSQLTELIKEGDLSARSKAISILPTYGKLPVKRLIFIGLGKEKQADFHGVKEAFGHAFTQIKKLKLTSTAVALDSFQSDAMEIMDSAQAFSEAFGLATYEFKGYKKASNEPEKQIEKLTVYTEADTDEIKAALAVGYALSKGTNSARTLVNTPGNLMTASDLAHHAEQLAETYGFEVEILEKAEIEKLGMGAFLAVNQGSAEPPKMITLKYQPKEEWTDVLGLVGKGVTFDTGGYSIKPKDGIVGMKTDMGGAAAVLGAMEIIGELKPDQNVVAVIPATDNMISGHAFKPDDVITSMSGKTIEVLNTDAEGRLVLADAITYAKHHGANYLVDVATLTGGVVIALGTDKTGVFANNDELYEEVLAASEEAGEFMWRLPLTEKDKERIRSSKIADLNNSPGREGHAIMGAGFIGEFAEGTPWVHLDIAGTADTNKSGPLGPDGATGVMARTLALLAVAKGEK